MKLASLVRSNIHTVLVYICRPQRPSAETNVWITANSRLEVNLNDELVVVR